MLYSVVAKGFFMKGGQSSHPLIAVYDPLSSQMLHHYLKET